MMTLRNMLLDFPPSKLRQGAGVEVLSDKLPL